MTHALKKDVTRWLAALGIGAAGLICTLSSLAAAELPTGTTDSWLQEEEEFLRVDEAFVFSTEVADGAMLARWDMPDGYYLYRHRFDFEVRDAAGAATTGVVLGPAEIPPGKPKVDEYFGDVEVYYHSAQVRIPIESGSGAVEIGISYQGCADAGLCYPPETKWVAFSASGASSGGAGTGTLSGTGAGVQAESSSIDAAAITGAADAAAVVSAGGAGAGPEVPATEEQVLASLLSDGTLWSSLLLFFLGGIALAFTPCVLPMVPILSSIIVGQSEEITRRRAFTLSLAYVIGMAVTYAFVGVLVGLFGASLNLQAALQSPPVLVGFAAVFVALSFSMFGFYELQLPQSWQNRLNTLGDKVGGGKHASVVVMGSVSSLVVSPCVSAPLAGALIYISATGDAVLGGGALLALGLGMGVPLLVIGSSGGHLLPKAGGWMNAVKAVFGVLLLGVAVWLLERVVPPAVTLALWAGLAVGCGVYLGALDFSPRQGWGQLWKATGAISFVYGVLLLIGAASGAENPLRPLQGLSIAGAGAPGASAGGVAGSHGGMQWNHVRGLTEFEENLRLAGTSGKPVLLDLYADWCISCKVMEREVFPRADVAAGLSQFHLIRADVTRNDEEDQALLKKFGLFGPPSLVFFAEDGTEITTVRVQGEIGADALAAHLSAVLTKLGAGNFGDIAANFGEN